MPITRHRDPEYGPSRCRSCRAVIVWALTEKGARIPVDIHPARGGNLELYTEHYPDGEPVDPGVQRVRRRPLDRPPGAPAWWLHWATCSATASGPRLPAELAAQLQTLLVRRWGPLFASKPRGGRA